MNGPFQVAQAGGISTSSTAATPVRIYKLTKPLTDQAVMVNLGYDQKVKIDFSAIANEKITLVHVGEKLIILFDNESTVTVEPFFKSRADGLGGETRDEITVEMAPGRDISVKEFATLFPITTDTSVLPAEDRDGNSNAQRAGKRRILQPVSRLTRWTLCPSMNWPRRKNWGTLLSRSRRVATSSAGQPPRTSRPRRTVFPASRRIRWCGSMTKIFRGQGNSWRHRRRSDAPLNASGVLAHDFGPDGAGTVLLSGAELPAGFTYAVNAEGTQLTDFRKTARPFFSWRSRIQCREPIQLRSSLPSISRRVATKTTFSSRSITS